MGTELPDRKGNRLKGYDYSARGVYFVTICTQNRVCNLGSVVGADARIGPHDGLNPDVHIELSPLGRIAEQALLQMDGLLHYVIMPNHIHLLVFIDRFSGRTQFAPTISRIIKQFKGVITKRLGKSIWQKGFYDHIIRDEYDFQIRWQYIEDNPYRWCEDYMFNKNT